MDTEVALARFLEYLRHERRYSVNTLKSYQRETKNYLHFSQQLGLSQCAAHRAHHIQEYLAQRHQAGLKASSIRQGASIIRSFFQFLCRENLLQDNPAAILRVPKNRRRLPKILDVDAMQKLLEISIDKDPLMLRDLAIFELAYSSGLRLSELIGVNLNDLDVKEKMLRVLGKGNKSRLVPVGSKALEAIERWLGPRTSMAANGENALFLSRKGRRIAARTVQARLRKFGFQQGLTERLHPHLLRHSFASHLLESSGNLKAVQDCLGHKDISTTQIYTHLNFQQLANSYDKYHPRARKRSR